MSETIERDGQTITLFTEEEIKQRIEEASKGLYTQEHLRAELDKTAAAARREAEGKYNELKATLDREKADDPTAALNARLAEFEKQLEEERGNRKRAEGQAAISHLVTTLQGKGLRKDGSRLAERVLAEYLPGDSELTDDVITDITKRVQTDYPVLFDTGRGKGGVPAGDDTTDKDAPPDMNDLIRGKAANPGS